MDGASSTRRGTAAAGRRAIHAAAIVARAVNDEPEWRHNRETNIGGGTKMLIAIVNKSSLVSSDDAAAMTRAIASQIRLDAAPLWDRSPAAVIFYSDPAAIPPAAHTITLTDTIEDAPAGVLGYHTEDQGGKLWGIVAAQPELSNGGKVTTGDWSVSSVLSHEVLEMYLDPNCNLWSNDGRGAIYTFEVCDPVEAPTYVVHDVSVSNFVTPAWFDPQAGSNAQFDKLGLLTAPFTILKGGYVVYAKAGQEQQKFGAEFPQWRRDMKQGKYARTRRRIAQASALG
jgi:hypothetical protein